MNNEWAPKEIIMIAQNIYKELFEVSHFPPGTSKWNRIEHRLFSQIRKNWRCRPLETIAVVISLISSTTTETGLKVKCSVDTKQYQTGSKINDEELAEVNIIKNDYIPSSATVL